MKGIVVFYEDEADSYSKELCFDGKSAENLAEQWAEKFSSFHISVKSATIIELFSQIQEVCQKNQADYVIFTYKDLPFLNYELTERLLEFHTKYKSEYTFADGYPYGLAPEIISADTIRILYQLAKTKQIEDGQKKVTRDGIYNFIKADINAYEVETVLAKKDWRLFRFNFHCGAKENFISCCELYKAIKKVEAENIKSISSDEVAEIAVKTPEIYKTVPGFYNIQISDAVGISSIYCPYEKAYIQKFGKSPLEATRFMAFEKFEALIDQISEFSEKAVVGLSAWGEPLKNPEILKFIKKILSCKGLSVLIETDGKLITDEFCKQIKSILDSTEERTNGWQKIMFIITMDAFTDATYKKLHGSEENLAQAVNAVAKLSEVCPHSVYPQFVRILENEPELEGFFRYWNEKSNASQGELIIQKYDDFAKTLPAWKPADLSPLQRNVCWHLRRDMTILTDGTVPFCREYVLDGIIGNAFEEKIEAIWKKTDSVLLEHINNQYNGKCKDCDEYYTYNF